MKESAADARAARGLAAGTGFGDRITIGIFYRSKDGVGLTQDGGIVELMPAQHRHPQLSRQGV